jgi:hypothetical protein
LPREAFIWVGVDDDDVLEPINFGNLVDDLNGIVQQEYLREIPM